MTGIQYLTDEEGPQGGCPNRPQEARRHLGGFLGRPGF